MKRDLLEKIISKYFDIVEENIIGGHYVDTDFLHYSELVECMVSAYQNESNAIFVTGLCLSPFQWFNVKIGKKEARDVNEVDYMETDDKWVNYLQYLHQLKEQGLLLYRYILCAGKGVEINEDFELTHVDTVNEQFKAIIIYKKNKGLTPLGKEEIQSLITQLSLNYQCYKNTKTAFFIVNAKDIEDKTIPKEYECELLKEFFQTNFHRASRFIKTRVFDKSLYKTEIICKKLPEDFFIIGKGSINSPTWECGLAADVVNFTKVRLWIMSDRLEAKEKIKIGASYEKRFSFTAVTDLVPLLEQGENLHEQY